MGRGYVLRVEGLNPCSSWVTQGTSPLHNNLFCTLHWAQLYILMDRMEPLILGLPKSRTVCLYQRSLNTRSLPKNLSAVAYWCPWISFPTAWPGENVYTPPSSSYLATLHIQCSLCRPMCTYLLVHGLYIQVNVTVENLIQRSCCPSRTRTVIWFGKICWTFQTNLFPWWLLLYRTLGFPSRCQHTVTQLKPSSKLAVQNVYLGMGPIGQCLLFDNKPEPGEEY
jgi:hypothetical protein